MDYIFYQVAADQRLRPVRPLPARRAHRQPLLDVRDRRPAPGCSSNFADQRRRERALSPSQARSAQGQRGRARRQPPGRRPARAPRRPRPTAAKPIADAEDRAARGLGQTLPGRRGPRRRPRAKTRSSARARPGASQAPARARACSTTCWGADREAPGASSIAANPVLIGAATTLVVDRRRVPRLQREQRPAVRADLRAQGRRPERGATSSRATRCGSAAPASAWSATSSPSATRTAR